MAASQLSEVMQHLRGTVLLREGAGLTDGQLLGCYIEQRDDAAFAALVRRHGPMVWGVCRRLLHPHDAEDAFQATFLVLVRKAASIVPRERVANWLYGVAHRTALQARRNLARRRAREKQVTEMREPAVTEQDLWRDLQPLLDRELSRLPDAYREVIVLSDLEGKTRKEVARQLGLPEGTVGSRLARARALLAKRLSRQGVTLSGGALAAVLAQQAASAGVPNSVVDATIQAASLLGAGTAVPAGAISLKVAALTEGVMKAMLFAKLKAAIAVVVALGLVATTITLLTCRTAVGQQDKPPAAEKPVKTPEKQGPVGREAPTKKTEAAKRLKLTLSVDKTETVLKPGTFYGADPVKLKLTFTNTGDKPIKLDAYALPYRIKFQCDGPGLDSVKKHLGYVDLAFIPPTEKDYPVLQPGKSWSPGWTPAFPGDIPDGAGVIAAYSLRQPGTYKLRMTVYDRYAPHVAGAAAGTKWLESNELELKVREKAPAGKGDAAKGLKLTLSADKTETVMKPDGSDAEPVKLKLTLTNVSDKAIKLNAYDLRWRLGFRCTGPSPDSIHTIIELVDRKALREKPSSKNYPVLQPGQSWSPEWTHSFPGDIPQETAKAVSYTLHKPGTYKLRFTYENPQQADGPLAKDAWAGSLESNELELKVRSKDLKIETGAEGMTVRAAGLHGAAPRIFHDETNGKLVLEGTQTNPATLVRSGERRNAEVRAAKIVYSLTDGTLRAESVVTLSSDK
jgi:RNA polymerase sigma factor (sigma-70 family)